MNSFFRPCATLGGVLALVMVLAVAASGQEQSPLRFLGNADLAPMIFVQDGHPTGVVVDKPFKNYQLV